MLIFTLPAVLEGGQVDALGIAIVTMPLWYSFGITFAAALVIGLPLTAILRRWDCETAVNYGVLGALFGFLIPVMTFGIASDWLGLALTLAVPGTLAGAITATTWGYWREGLRWASDPEPPDQPAKPIHDLIH
ncbi:hypothetical protein GRI89_16465 [Altererythrobacter salegens]|uniref:Uncharacterized protein n=1 Tax=Croceibacterium salegens TaxID=1737568 RepID=A0A6I4T0N7_9SPHN|nr:hypothetical protein [Croceibacterium salegens]MXO61138.1 hypothetical protein [Croceibacterium salegens]